MLCQKKIRGRWNMKGRGWQTDWNDRSREQGSGKERDSGVSSRVQGSVALCRRKTGKRRWSKPSNGGRCELSLLLYCKGCCLWFVEETVEHHCFLKIGKRERHLWQVDTELMTRSPIDQMTSKLRSPAVSSTPTEPVIWWLRERGVVGKKQTKWVGENIWQTNTNLTDQKFARYEAHRLLIDFVPPIILMIFLRFSVILDWYWNGVCIGGKAFASDSEQNRKVLMARKALTKSLRLIDQSPDLGRGQQSTSKHLH